MSAATPAPTQGGPALYFPTLDGLRFVAFLLVFIHHVRKAGHSVLAMLHDQGWVDCVVKVPALMENPTLHPLPSLLEWVGVAIARALRVPVPEPLNVRWSRELAAATIDATWREALLASSGSVFGSTFIAGLPLVRAELLETSLRGAALRVLFFDVFVPQVEALIEASV